MKHDDKMCPSTPATSATVLLGVVMTSGRLAYATPTIPAEAVMQATDDNERPLEAKYRFAGPCVESRCGYWSGNHCGLGARLAESYAGLTDDVAGHLPRCAIRAQCRWFAEQGAAACAACPLVVTDNRKV